MPLLLTAASLAFSFPAYTDTVGLTSVDYQNYGPVWQRIYNLPQAGVHVTWLKTGMAANYFNYTTGQWRREVNVFGALRNAAGNLDVSPNPGPYYGSAFISTWLTRNPKAPAIAVESTPGSGIYAIHTAETTLMGCTRPAIALTAQGWLHMLCTDSGTGDTLLYSRSTDHGASWSEPVNLCAEHPPNEPTYNIAASDSSEQLAAVWSVASDRTLYLNRSNDGGITWTGPETVPSVPSDIPDAGPGRLGAFALFDRDDRLNLVTQVWNGADPRPAEIWHWQEGRNPQWTRVYRFEPLQPLAPPEPGDPFLLRPSIGQRLADGRFFVAWMNYDSANYEPQTQLSRADIFVSQSSDNGITWSRPLRLTGPDNGSRISPCLAATVTDTLTLACITDQISGTFELGHGGQTTNTVNVIFLPVSEIPALAGPHPISPSFNHSTSIMMRKGAALPPEIILPSSPLADATGRTIAILHPGQNTLRDLTPGIYFLLRPDSVYIQILLVP